MITLKQSMRLSAIVDKLGLKTPDASKGQEQAGADIILQLITKAHKAEKEIYAFVAEVRGCTPKEAQDVDLFEFIKEIMENAEMRDFFSATVESQAQN